MFLAKSLNTNNSIFNKEILLYDKGTEKPFGFGSGACVGSGVGAWVGSGVGAWVGFGNEIFFSKMTSKHSINSLFFHK